MRNREAEKYQYKSIKILEKMKSQVKIVKTKMAERHVTQPVKDVSISTQMDRDFPITTLMLCEVYPDAQLNTTTMTWALYTFTISALMDVSTTWGVQTARYCRWELLHHMWLPDVSGCYWIFQHHLLWSRGYLRYLAFTITGLKDAPRCLQPVVNPQHHYSGAESTWPSPSPASS